MVFGRAKECSPCVLLLDDIDSISPKRETAQREMEKRIVSQLFASMDELDSIQSPILVIGTTSRIDSLDAGLRRSLRFDQEISLGIPDSTARTKILQVLCKELTIDDGLDYSLLAQLTPGYVGADLCALIREASMSAVNKLLLKESCDGNVTVDKMAELLKSRVPLSEEELKTVSIDLNDFMVS
jgi:ribosome biogenesis ATPase